MKLSRFAKCLFVSTVLILLPTTRSEASSKICSGCVAGIAGAAAALGGGITAALLVHHYHTSVTGCVLDKDGKLTLTADNGKTYELQNAPAELKAHQRVYLRGHKEKTGSERMFDVSRISRDYGECQ